MAEQVRQGARRRRRTREDNQMKKLFACLMLALPLAATPAPR